MYAHCQLRSDIYDSDDVVQSGEGRGHWKSSHVTTGIHSLCNKSNNEVAKPSPVNQKKVGTLITSLN